MYPSTNLPHNILTNQHQLSFDIEMWNMDAQQTVYLAIKQLLNDSVLIHNVHPVPMEKMRIVWEDAGRVDAEKYEIPPAWTLNSHQAAIITFSIHCSTENACDQLKNAVLEQPECLTGLQLEYVKQVPQSFVTEIFVMHTNATNNRIRFH